MKAIVVVDENWAIGKNGGLLVHLPGELKYFREKTLGKTLIMGRATLESLPGGKPLPGRKTIVLTRDLELSGRLPEGALAVNSAEAVIKRLLEDGQPEEAFVAGGEQVYRRFLPDCRQVYVTKLQKKFDGADKFFPDLDALDCWRMVWESEIQEENGIKYRFTRYERV